MVGWFVTRRDSVTLSILQSRERDRNGTNGVNEGWGDKETERTKRKKGESSLSLYNGSASKCTKRKLIQLNSRANAHDEKSFKFALCVC